MKKIVSILFLLAAVTLAWGQKAQIEFESLTHDFGKISLSDPVVTCTFVYTNTGSAPLVIHQAVASCGCTVPEYTRTPVKPGEKGEIKVTFNGSRSTGATTFKKTITIRSNAEVEVVRLNITGELVKGE